MYYASQQEPLGKPTYVCVVRGICKELKICEGKLDPYSRPDFVHGVTLVQQSWKHMLESSQVCSKGFIEQNLS